MEGVRAKAEEIARTTAEGGGWGGSVVVELPLGKAAATFYLEKAVCSHGLFMMAPNYWDPLSKTLRRPLRLDFDDDYGNDASLLLPPPASLIVRICQPSNSPYSLRLHVFGRDSLSPQYQQVLLDQVRRMLRLSEAEETNVAGFQQMHAEAKQRGFGREFRSPTLFEDMVKCMLLCNYQHEDADERISGANEVAMGCLQRFLVRWKHRPDFDATWITEEEFHHIDPELLAHYLRQHSTEQSSFQPKGNDGDFDNRFQFKYSRRGRNLNWMG